jgi:hypothetical protein
MSPLILLQTERIVIIGAGGRLVTLWGLGTAAMLGATSVSGLELLVYEAFSY